MRFTIYHGFAASLVLHSAVAAAVVLSRAELPVDKSPSLLVVHLQGVIAETQAEAQVLGQEAEEVRRDAAAAAQPVQPPPVDAQPEPPREVAAAEIAAKETPPSPAVEVQQQQQERQETAAANVGAEAEQQEQTIQAEEREREAERMRDYVMTLSKKMRSNLVYPDSGRRAAMRGVATASFTITGDGQIRQETLRIVKSSGQSILDAAALQTIRASAPFDPPPREISVTIEVDFGRNF